MNNHSGRQVKIQTFLNWPFTARLTTSLLFICDVLPAWTHE